MKLEGKYIPIANFKHYTANFVIPEKRDASTGQLIRAAKNLSYHYHLVLDTLGNVFMLPRNEDCKTAFDLTDIVRAKSGDKSAADKIENARQSLLRQFGADLTSDKWTNTLYHGIYENNDYDVKRDFELNCCFEMQRDVVLPDTVSNYTSITEEQILSLAKTATLLKN